jgi:cold shock CspA family protein
MKGIGKIKFYNEEKGYGFITSGAQDIFFHVTDFNQELYGDPDKDLMVVFTVSRSIDRKNQVERLRAREIIPVADDAMEPLELVPENDDAQGADKTC